MLETNVDRIFNFIKEQQHTTLSAIHKQLQIEKNTIKRITDYLEESQLIEVDYGATAKINYLQDPIVSFEKLDATELITKLKFLKDVKDLKAANKLVIDVYNYYKRVEDAETSRIYKKVRKYYEDNFVNEQQAETDAVKTLENYSFPVEDITIEVDIIQQPLEPVPFYLISQLKVSDVTREVITRIKEEVVRKIINEPKNKNEEVNARLRKEYEQHVSEIMRKVFEELDEEELQAFATYVIVTSLGMGEVEFLLHDEQLEEIVVNNAYEPVRVYHSKFGWMETNITPTNEGQVIHFATLAGRAVEKTITTLYPLMDAHLETGDRVNATLAPISTHGSTLTIRKFAASPWTITDFLKSGTIDYKAAAIIWTAIQYELSVLIVGGTGSGKTSALNVFSLFIVPNQRIVSIEDTRELRLPSTLHWVPMETRSANPEGQGEVSMLDLVVNSLRMRPDRIIVGEIRRKKEAEVLFEAMHTGHSAYATLHANTVEEAVIRLTTDPIGLSKTLLGALDLMIVQNRNRRTNTRRTFQLAEMSSQGDFNLLYNYKFEDDKLHQVNAPKEFYKRLELFSGLSKKEVDKALEEKVQILKYLVENNVDSIEEIGQIISYYYIDKAYLMKSLFEEKKE